MGVWNEDGARVGFTLSEQAARKTAETYRKVAAMPVNVVGNQIGRNARGTNSTLHWITFANTYAGMIPGHGVIKLVSPMSSIGADSGGTPGTLGPVYSATRPDGTLGLNYAINGCLDIPQGGFGQALISGEVEALYDSSTGTPSDGQGWGPQKDSFLLAYGRPTLCVVPGGAYDTAGTTMVFNLEPIRRVLGQPASGSIPAFTPGSGAPGTASCNVWIWTGSAFVVSSPAVTFTGANVSSSAISSLTEFIEVDGNWIAIAGSSGGMLIFRAVLTADMASTDSTGTFSGGLVTLTAATAPSGVTSANNFEKLTGKVGDTIYVLQNTSSMTPSYEILQCVPHSKGGSGLYKGNLGATLNPTDASATVGTLTSLDDGTTITPGTAANTYSNAGITGSPCLIGTDNSTGTPSYFVIRVKNAVVYAVDNIATTPSALQMYQKHIAVETAEPGDTETDVCTLYAKTFDTNVYWDGTTLFQTQITCTVLGPILGPYTFPIVSSAQCVPPAGSPAVMAANTAAAIDQGAPPLPVVLQQFFSPQITGATSALH